MLIWVIGVLAAFALFGIIGGGLVVLTGAQTRVQSRVQQYVALEEAAAPVRVAAVRRRRRADVFEDLDARFGQTPAAQRIATEIERGGLSLTVTELTLLRLGAAVLLAAIAIALVPGFWWLVILPAAVIGAWLPRMYVARRARARLQRLDDQLPDTLSLLAGAVRSGSSLFQALDRIAQEAEEPTREEFLRVVRTISLGAPVETALRGLAERMPTEEIDILTTAITIQQQTGGNIGQILELIATTVRERHRIQREIRVLSAQQRLSAYLLGALPLLMIGVLFLISPTYIGRIFQPGWILILPISIAVLLVVGFVVMNRIARIDV